ncbi:MAG: ABC transporter ATP-binding protein [Bacteroidota bacterium]
MLNVNKVSKTFSISGRQLSVLENINFSVTKKETLAIVGPSGSGKTTLLGICAGLDIPTEGIVTLDDVSLNALTEDDRAYLRNQKIGFIFQNFQLLTTLTALENVMVPLDLRGDGQSAKEKALALLTRVGLADRLDHFPSQLSGGEQQRVALARAFITDPAILFADEPTGNLDGETADEITDLIFEMNSELGTTLVMVTHNLELAEKTDRILFLKSGRLVEDKRLRTN